MKDKQPSFIKLYRYQLDLMKKLSDSEFRLLVIFMSLAGWDPRHEKKYGIIDKTIRELQIDHIPSWKSTGKFSKVTRKLISRGALSKVGTRKIKLAPSLSSVKQKLPVDEQKVSPEERNVPNEEQNDTKSSSKNFKKDLGIKSNLEKFKKLFYRKETKDI